MESGGKLPKPTGILVRTNRNGRFLAPPTDGRASSILSDVSSGRPSLPLTGANIHPDSHVDSRRSRRACGSQRKEKGTRHARFSDLPEISEARSGRVSAPAFDVGGYDTHVSSIRSGMRPGRLSAPLPIHNNDRHEEQHRGLPGIQKQRARAANRLGAVLFYHVDESIRPLAKNMSALPPAQTLTSLRPGKNGTVRAVKRQATFHEPTNMSESMQSHDRNLLQYLSMLNTSATDTFESPVRSRTGTSKAIFGDDAHVLSTSNSSSSNFIEAIASPVPQPFGAAEALDRMADYAVSGGVWKLLNGTGSRTPPYGRSRSRLGADNSFERYCLGTPISTTPRHTLVGYLRSDEGFRLGTGHVDLIRLGTGHAAMATRAGRRYSRPATQAAREEEEALYAMMVQEFPQGWVKEAAGYSGEKVWSCMTAKQQVGIVHALLADTESALPLIKTMKKIFETVDGFDIDEEEKRAKYSNKTGISALDEDISVNVDSKEVQDLMTELLCVAVKCNQISQAVRLLEGIPDAAQRDEASELLFHLSDEMLCHELRDLLNKRGFVSHTQRRKNARTPSHPSKQKKLPQAAQRRLESRHRREAQAAAVVAARRKSLMLDEASFLTDDDELEDDDNTCQSRQSPIGCEENIVESDKTIENVIFSCGDSPKEEINSEADEEMVPNKNNLCYGEVEEAIVTVVDQSELAIPVHNPEDYIKREDFGIDNDPDLMYAEEVESSDDEYEAMEFPPGHPVAIIFGKIMDRVKALMYSMWKAWAEDQRADRYKIRAQYLSNCGFARLTPVGVQRLHRFMLPNSSSSSTLNLSKQSFSKSTIGCLLEALIGLNAMDRSHHARHPGCFPSWVNINELREELGDEPMTEIDLSYNDLQHGGVCILRDSLLQNSSWRVQVLKLDANDLREQGCIAIIPLLTTRDLPLQHLSIAKNGIGDTGVMKLVEVLGNNKQLLSLNISNNACAFKTAKSLGEMLVNNNTLKKLDCSYNLIRSEGAVSLAQGLAENAGLKEINLSWNGFGDSEPCDQIAAAMESSSLTIVDLGYNRINRNEAVILSSYLERCPNITKLVLDGNMVTQSGARMIMTASKTAAGEDAEFFAEISMLNCGIGIIDHSAFDPNEPAGDYELDLKDKFSRNVLLSLFRIVAQGRGFFLPWDDLKGIPIQESRTDDDSETNAMYAEAVEPILKVAKEGSKDRGKKKGKKKKGSKSQVPLRILPPLVFNPYRLKLPMYSMPDGSRTVNPDESEWKIPKDGTIKFKFGSSSVGGKDVLDSISLKKIVDVFCNTEKTHIERMESFDLHLGSHTSIHFGQVRKLLEALPTDDHDRLREKDRAATRSAVVIRCFHRLVETDEARNLLDLLEPGSKQFASKALGAASFSFTRRNASGHYRLNLEVCTDRELCLRLVECYNEQRQRMKQLDKDSATRQTGVAREKIERIWRNLRVDGKPVLFDPSWRVPHVGRLQVDFVVINKPTRGSKAMPSGQFRDWSMQELDKWKGEEIEVVNSIRTKSDTCLFSCEQISRLVRRVTLPELRVEICVIAFARTVDFHNFKYIMEYLTVSEVISLQSRLGLINLWDECMSVGYYDLDLALSEHRWICQELLILAAEEGGGQVIETSYEMVDFEVPSTWLRELPKKGIFQCYYIRDVHTVRTVRERGTVSEHRINPFFWNEPVDDHFDDDAFSAFMPSWIKLHAKDSDDGTLHEPPGREWTNEHRLRRIQTRLYEAFGNVDSAMEQIDKDLSGELDVRELVISLNSIKIWLNTNQLAALVVALDKDANGTVTIEELRRFWEQYSSDWQVSAVRSIPHDTSPSVANFK